MRTPSFFGLILCVALAAAARAETAPDDAPLIKACSGELADRLFGATAHGEAFIVSQAVTHEAARTLVRLDLASGEGRRIAGTCIFRDGKLFDVKS